VDEGLDQGEDGEGEDDAGLIDLDSPATSLVDKSSDAHAPPTIHEGSDL